MPAASYIRLSEQGRLSRVSAELKNMLEKCRLCPNSCEADRMAGEKGLCGAGVLPSVGSYHPHYGEESCLSGTRGSGTIFFAYCNLSCIYCQNAELSYYHRGREVSPRSLSNIMLELQRRGCHNINLVSPVHFLPAVLSALEYAVSQGLSVPLVYNSGGYESVPVLRLLEGVFDIYLPDFKYGSGETAERLSGIKDYPRRAGEAIEEMHRQVGTLATDSRGVALKGLLVRHLVLPGDLSGSAEVMNILSTISREITVNIMDQYHPAHRAWEEALLSRRISLGEYNSARKAALRAGLRLLPR